MDKLGQTSQNEEPRWKQGVINPRTVDVPPEDPSLKYLNDIDQVKSRGFLRAIRSEHKDIIEPKVRGRLHDQQKDKQIQWRDVPSEPRFQHLERVFSGITSSINPHEAGTHIHHEPPVHDTSSIMAMSRTCNARCRCKCHSGRGFTAWNLSAFKSALGSFSFIFAGRLGEPPGGYDESCESPHSTTIRVTYAFPTWLLHAAISGTFSDRSGTPELVIRVLHRISSDTTARFGSIVGHITRGDTENVRRMLQRRQASIYDIKGDDGKSLLGLAIGRRNFDIVQLLLQEGADLFQVDDHGHAAFYGAVQFLYGGTHLPNSPRHILEQYMPLDQIVEYSCLTDLHKVVMGINCLGIQEYIGLHAGSIADDLNVGDSDGRTPLFYASARGDAIAVQALLEAGASANVSFPPAWERPLFIACNHGHLEVVRRLIDAGADVNALNKFSSTPLHATCGRGRDLKYYKHAEDASDWIKIATELLVHGADVNAATRMGGTGLDFACYFDQAPLVAFLLESGADPNHRDWEGTNALGNAIVGNACGAVVELLRNGVDYRNIDVNGLGILHYVGMSANTEMLELLAKSSLVGLDIALQTSTGRTPLQIFEARVDAEDVFLKEAFIALLASVSLGDDSESELEPEEYFDALES